MLALLVFPMVFGACLLPSLPIYLEKDSGPVPVQSFSLQTETYLLHNVSVNLPQITNYQRGI